MDSQVIVALISFGAGVIVTTLTGGLARRLKISEFRQAWISSLRDDIAAYLGTTQRWFNAASREEEGWKQFGMGNEATVILYRIRLRINPHENVHKKEDDEFLNALAKIQSPSNIPKAMLESYWAEAADDVADKARKLLKREWETTKRMRLWQWR